jgi:hypothetical protein
MYPTLKYIISNSHSTLYHKRPTSLSPNTSNANYCYLAQRYYHLLKSNLSFSTLSHLQLSNPPANITSPIAFQSTHQLLEYQGAQNGTRPRRRAFRHRLRPRNNGSSRPTINLSPPTRTQPHPPSRQRHPQHRQCSSSSTTTTTSSAARRVQDLASTLPHLL